MKDNRVIRVASKKELENSAYESRLWLVAKNEQMSRRRYINEIAITIYDFEGTIQDERGRLWNIPDVYELFGEGGRWLSQYLEDEDGRPRRKPRSITLERRRLIDLYYRIKFPHIAEKIAR